MRAKRADFLKYFSDFIQFITIVLICSADGNYEVRYKSNILIYPNGEVLWVPPAIYQSSCTIDVTYFPFDQQTCIMKFGSWTFNGDQVSLALYNDKNFVDLSDYWKSGTWDIVNVPAYLNVHKEQEPTETDITFYIIIRRKTLFYTVNLILPTVLISFLCVLVFYLPAEAGEKVTLGISILLSLVVFLLLVSKILPPTSLVLPLIAKYLLFTFVMNTVSILVTVIIINWNFRGPRTHRMPQMIRKIFLKILPAILLMRRPKKTRLRWMMEIPNVTLPASTYSGSPTEIPKHLPASLNKPKMEVMELSDLHHPNCKINRKVHHTGGSSAAGGGNETMADRRGSESSDSVLLSPEASKATEAVEFIAEHLRNEDLYIQVSQSRTGLFSILYGSRDRSRRSTKIPSCLRYFLQHMFEKHVFSSIFEARNTVHLFFVKKLSRYKEMKVKDRPGCVFIHNELCFLNEKIITF